MKILDNVSIPVVDHCNLSCRGCFMFSPMAEKYYANTSSIKNDCKRLSEIFDYVREIRIFGGEPLLHPDIINIISACRVNNKWPYTSIHLLTNGVSLPNISEDFWMACHNNNVDIIVSVYKNSFGFYSAILERSVKFKVNVRFNSPSLFCPTLNLKGNSIPEIARKRCRGGCSKLEPAPHIRDGIIYPCHMPIVVKYFNNKFGSNLPTGKGLDIYKSSCDDIIDFISNGIDEQCSYCSEIDGNPFGFSECEKTCYNIKEWDVTSTTGRWIKQEVRNRQKARGLS